MQAISALTGKNSFSWILLASGVVLGATVLFVFNPATAVFYPKCLFHEMTGFYCPGCGTTRALHGLLHGDIRTALHENALATLALPVLGAILLARAIRRRPPVGASRGAWTRLAVLLGVILAFGVLRNIPRRPFSLLAPPPAAAGNSASHVRAPMR
jgi:hypothetical protein